ncbi:hypothetical protein DFJ73DRAFT_806605 [Zopfochytrium polystomum]|nr:hypothetical protein DFJ73DRAFT_806605 [Zopfochytrium polystomum]
MVALPSPFPPEPEPLDDEPVFDHGYARADWRACLAHSARFLLDIEPPSPLETPATTGKSASVASAAAFLTPTKGSLRRSVLVSAPGSPATATPLRPPLAASPSPRRLQRLNQQNASPAAASSFYRPLQPGSPQRRPHTVEPVTLPADEIAEIPLRLAVVRDVDLIYCVHGRVTAFARAAGDALSSSSAASDDGGSEGGEDRGTVVAAERTVVRMINLAAWKRACERLLDAVEDGASSSEALEEVARKACLAVPYQELNVPIDFVVRQVEVNATGKLLAVAGDDNVMVIVLPMSSKYSGRVKEVKSYSIRGLLDGTTVAKIKWHPLSEGDNHLMVLTSDGCLRIFNTSQSPEKQEQTFWFSDLGDEFGAMSLSPQKRKGARPSGRFGTDLDAKEAVSFGIGGGSGWGPYTVYCLMRNGDIFSMCPVAPKRSNFDIDHLTELREYNAAQWKESNDGDHVSERIYYWRNRWLEECLGTASVMSGGATSSSPSKATGTLPKLKLALQGPHLLTPVDPLVEEAEAVDLCLLAVDPVPVMAVSYKNGRVYVCIETEPVEPFWLVNGLDQIPVPRWHIYECIDLKGEGSSARADDLGAVLLYTNNNNQDTVFVSHSKGIHSIHCTSWLEKLSQSPESHPSIFERHVPSLVQCLANTAGFDQSETDPTTSFSIFCDVILGQTFIAFTSKRQLHTKAIPMKTKVVDLATGVNKMSLSEKSSSSAVAAKAKQSGLNLQPFSSLLSGPFQIPPAIATENSRLPSERIPSKAVGYPEFLSEGSLKAFTTKVSTYQKEVADLNTAGETLDSRIWAMEKEIENQTAYLTTITAAMDQRLLPRTARIGERLEAVNAQQERLSSRTEALLQLLHDASQPELNRDEIAFIEELTALNHRMKQFYRPHVKELQNQKRAVLEHMRNAKNEGAGALRIGANQIDTSGALSSAQVQKIGAALAKEYQMIVKAWERFGEVQRQMEALSLSGLSR